MSVGNTSGRRAVVAMVDRIDAPHGSFASLLFNYVRDESWRARDHENAVERCGIHSQVGENGADRTSYIDGQRFLRLSERFLDGARCLHMYAFHAGFACKLEQARGARILRVQPMTKPRHAFTCLAHLPKRARRCLL